MLVYLSESRAKIEKEIGAVSQKYKYASITKSIAPSAGKSKIQMVTVEGELTKIALLLIRIKICLLALVTLGNYLKRPSTKEELAVLKTKKLETTFSLYSDSQVNVQKVVEKKFEDKEGNEKVWNYRQKADAKAFYELGKCYQDGNEGVAKNLDKAIAYYKKAIAKGHVNAEFDLGYCYHQLGKKEEAVKQWQTAASKGDLGAKSNLGVCYMNGEGITQDKTAA